MNANLVLLEQTAASIYVLQQDVANAEHALLNTLAPTYPLRANHAFAIKADGPGRCVIEIRAQNKIVNVLVTDSVLPLEIAKKHIVSVTRDILALTARTLATGFVKEPFHMAARQVRKKQYHTNVVSLAAVPTPRKESSDQQDSVHTKLKTKTTSVSAKAMTA